MEYSYIFDVESELYLTNRSLCDVDLTEASEINTHAGSHG